MAGRIKDADISAVRDALRIEDIVGEIVTLKSAGMDSQKGLCPFHDEKTPSFHVRPSANYYHCFGCGEHGDAITFIQKIHHLTFVEAVETLAQKAGITLHYEEGSQYARKEEPGKRQRLLDAHTHAAAFYQQQLGTAEAMPARQFLADRHFTQEVCAHFGIGYSPHSWDSLTRHLRSKGFTDQELIVAGLATQGNRGVYDRFRGRLMWPIRDITGATVGFGARRLDDSDKESPKYLNTPETPIYKKSQLLYGLDLAKKAMKEQRKVVIVEGYTDVMAAHVAGELCAVATCGTAFGSEHVKIVRRIIGDQADPAAGLIYSDGRTQGGEVIFTFDGDEAGQKAAMRAFHEDQNFAAQTFVAVEKTGKDPCDLRMTAGDHALRALIDSRVPLFEFVIRSVLASVDLRTVEGRVAGLRVAAPIVSGIKDQVLRGEYTRQLAGWLGMDIREVTAQVRRSRPVSQGAQFVPEDSQGSSRGPRGASQRRGNIWPTANVASSVGGEDPVARVERLALEAVLQYPTTAIASGFEDLEPGAFAIPSYQAVHDAILSVGGIGRFQELLGVATNHFQSAEEAHQAAATRFVQEVVEAAGPLDGVVTQLLVRPLPSDRPEQLHNMCRGYIAALVRKDITHRIAQAKAELTRVAEGTPEHAELFERLLTLETRKRYFDPSET